MEYSTIHQKLWPRLKIADNGCWVWQGGKDEDGYGALLWRHGQESRAHRVAYKLAFGAIPEGAMICHHCDNPPCCNPLHLFVGNGQINHDDMVAKGRWDFNWGDRVKWAKLTNWQAMEIRRRVADGETQRKLAVEFGVHYKNVNGIACNRTWKHLPPKIPVGS